MASSSDIAGKHVMVATAVLPPDAVQAAQERGRVRELWTTLQELLSELEARMEDIS